MAKKSRQYGTWPSPISPGALAGGLRLNDVQWDNSGHTLVWLEGRGDRGTLVAQVGVQAPRDLNSELSVRARVGYGGGEFTVAGGQVYFAGPSGRLYKQSLAGGGAKPITPAFGYAAAPRVSADGKWLLFVHTYERTDGLALVDTDGKIWPRKMAFGTDFLMQPAWNPEGTHIAYIAWNHPQMPWDGTELRLATLDYDAQGIPYVAETETVIGDTDTAILQPEFSPDGRYLAYVSDETGLGQLYVYDLAEQKHIQLTETEAEHGQPAWVQGIRVYGWTGDGRSIYYLRNEQGFYKLCRYDMRQGTEKVAESLSHYTSMGQIAVSPVSDEVALIASSVTIPSRIVTFESERGQKTGEFIRRRSRTESIPQAKLAGAQPITWTGHDGEPVFGLYYEPTSESYQGVGAPPLIVDVHGGPTGQRTARYESDVQFFATRGFAFLAVNYRGSPGYGRAYMEKLRGNWGIYDVEDSASGALYLVEQGLADRSKLVIKGGSAGGFTVLQSLVDKPGFYKAGVCLYGVSNQFLLVQDTHKFEERYSDSLLGPLPEAADVYRERSPIFHADKINDPVIVFQGADDRVVPKNQSDSIVASLRARGVPYEYHVYEGEGHGFRKPETIEAYYKTVMKFLIQHVIYT